MKYRLSLSLGVLGVIGGLYAFWPKARTHDEASAKVGEQPSPSLEVKSATTPTLGRSERGLPEQVTKRDEKVAAQLNLFIERTKDMTAESVSAEQERIKARIKESEAREAEVPKIQLITDEQGEKWEKLEFRDGVVRYRPVPEAETVP